MLTHGLLTEEKKMQYSALQKKFSEANGRSKYGYCLDLNFDRFEIGELVNASHDGVYRIPTYARRSWKVYR